MVRGARCPHPGEPGTVMNQWPIWVLACLGLCGCQPPGPVSDEPCPSPSPCYDEDFETRLLRGPGTLVREAAYRRLWPGCPETIQVMARMRPVVFKAVRPDNEPDNDADPSDWACDPPEAPLLRAGRDREGRQLVRADRPLAGHGN
jgi:hypothetical protein